MEVPQVPDPQPVDVQREERILRMRDAVVDSVRDTTPTMEDNRPIEMRLEEEDRVNRMRQSSAQDVIASPQTYLPEYIQFQRDHGLKQRGIDPMAFRRQWEDVLEKSPSAGVLFNEPATIERAMDWTEFVISQDLDRMLREGIDLQARGWLQQHADQWRISRITEELRYLYGIRAIGDLGRFAPEALQGTALPVYDPMRVMELEDELATIPIPEGMGHWIHGFTLGGVSMAPQMWEYTKGGLSWGIPFAAYGAAIGAKAGGVGALPGALVGFGSGFSKGFSTRMAIMSVGGVRRQLDQMRTADGGVMDETTANLVGLVGGAAIYALEKVAFDKLNAAVLGVPGRVLGQTGRSVVVPRAGTTIATRLMSAARTMAAPARGGFSRNMGGLFRAGATEFWTEVAQEGATDLTLWTGNLIHQWTNGEAFEVENEEVSAMALRYLQAGIAGFQASVGFGLPMVGVRATGQTMLQRLADNNRFVRNVVSKVSYTNEAWRVDVLEASNKMHDLGLPKLDKPGEISFRQAAVGMLHAQHIGNVYADAEGLVRFIDGLQGEKSSNFISAVNEALSLPVDQRADALGWLRSKAESSGKVVVDSAMLLVALEETADRARMLKGLSVDMEMIRPVDTARLVELVRRDATTEELTVSVRDIRTLYGHRQAIAAGEERNPAITSLARAHAGVHARMRSVITGVDTEATPLFDVTLDEMLMGIYNNSNLTLSQVLQLANPVTDTETIDQTLATQSVAEWAGMEVEQADRIRAARELAPLFLKGMVEVDFAGAIPALIGLRNWLDGFGDPALTLDSLINIGDGNLSVAVALTPNRGLRDIIGQRLSINRQGGLILTNQADDLVLSAQLNSLIVPDAQGNVVGKHGSMPTLMLRDLESSWSSMDGTPVSSDVVRGFIQGLRLNEELTADESVGVDHTLRAAFGLLFDYDEDTNQVAVTDAKLGALSQAVNALLTSDMASALEIIEQSFTVDPRVATGLLHEIRNYAMESYKFYTVMARPVSSNIARVFDPLLETQNNYFSAARVFTLPDLIFDDAILVENGLDPKAIKSYREIMMGAVDRLVQRALDDRFNKQLTRDQAEQEVSILWAATREQQAVDLIQERGGLTRADVRLSKLTKTQKKTLSDWGLLSQDPEATPDTALQRYHVPWDMDKRAMDAGVAMVEGVNVTVTLQDGRRVTKVPYDPEIRKAVWLFRDGTRVTQDGEVYFPAQLGAPWRTAPAPEVVPGQPADMGRDRRRRVFREDTSNISLLIRSQIGRASVERDIQLAAEGDPAAIFRQQMRERTDASEQVVDWAEAISEGSGRPEAEAGARNFHEQHGVHPWLVAGIPRRLQQRNIDPSKLITRERIEAMGISWPDWEMSPWFTGDPDFIQREIDGGFRMPPETDAELEARRAQDPEWQFFAEVVDNPVQVAEAGLFQSFIESRLPPVAQLDVEGLAQEVRGVPVTIGVESELQNLGFADVRKLANHLRKLGSLGEIQTKATENMMGESPDGTDVMRGMSEYGFFSYPEVDQARRVLLQAINVDDVDTVIKALDDQAMASFNNDPVTMLNDEQAMFKEHHYNMTELSRLVSLGDHLDSLTATDVQRAVYAVIRSKIRAQLAGELRQQMNAESSRFLDGVGSERFGAWNRDTFIRAAEANENTHTVSGLKQIRAMLVKFASILPDDLAITDPEGNEVLVKDMIPFWQQWLLRDDVQQTQAESSIIPGEAAMFWNLFGDAVLGDNDAAMRGEVTLKQMTDTFIRLQSIEAASRATKRESIPILDRRPELLHDQNFADAEVERTSSFRGVVDMLVKTVGKLVKAPRDAEKTDPFHASVRFLTDSYLASTKLITLLMREADNFTNYKGRGTDAEVGPFERLFGLGLQNQEGQRLQHMRVLESGGEFDTGRVDQDGNPIKVTVAGIEPSLAKFRAWWESLAGEEAELVSNLQVPEPVKTEAWNTIYQQEVEKGTDPAKAKDKADAMAGIRKPFTTMTPELLLMVALNMGNDHNRQAMLKGWGFAGTEANNFADRFGLTEASLEAYREALPLEMWRVVQDIYNTIGVLREPVFDAHESIYGFRPEEVQPNRINTREWYAAKQEALDRGATLVEAEMEADGTGAFIEGGYFPLRFDLVNASPQALEATRLGRPAPVDIPKSMVDQQDDNAALAALFPPSAHRSFTTGREDVAGGLSPMLSLGVLFEHLDMASRYGAYAEMAWELDRIVTDTSFQTAFTNRFGSEKYKILRPHLRNLLSPDRVSRDFGDRFFAGIRSKAITYFMWGNVGPVLRQPASLTLAAREVGLVPMVTSAVSVTTDLLRSVAASVPGFGRLARRDADGNPISMWAQALRDSHQLRERWRGYDASMLDAANRLRWDDSLQSSWRPWARLINQTGYFATQSIDRAASITTYWAAYNQASAAGSTHQEASLRAYQAVALTQGSPFGPDRSALSNSRGAGSLFAMFMTSRIVYANTMGHDLNYVGQHGLMSPEAAQRIPGFIYGMGLAFGAMTVYMMSVRASWNSYGERLSRDEDETVGQIFRDSTVNDVVGSFPIYGDIASGLLQTSGFIEPQFGGRLVTTAALEFLNRHIRSVGSGVRDLGQVATIPFVDGDQTIPGNQFLDQFATPEGVEKNLAIMGLLLAITTGLPGDRMLFRMKEGYRQMMEDDGTIMNLLYPDPTRWNKRQTRPLPPW